MAVPARPHPRPFRAEPLEPRRLLAAVSGTVYNDANADAVRNPFIDLGLGGWTVYVDANENGAFDAGELNAASAAGGAWSITSAAFRPRTDYSIRTVAQSGWRPTEPAAGLYSVSFATTSDTVTGQDFGQTRRALVTGTVFHDVNDDGTWDREPGQSGRTVFADANDNGALDPGESTDATDVNGDYALSPAAGTYVIRQVQQAGWWQTAPAPATAGHPLTLANAQSVAGRHFGNIAATIDLLGVGFAVTSAIDPVPADGRVDVLYQIRNDGTADSPGFRAAFYLSQDANITTADTFLRSIAQGSVPRHGTVDRTTGLTLPEPDPFRNDNEYWVGMIVDSDGDVAETNEANNSNRGPLLDRFPVSSEGHLPRPADGTGVRAQPLTLGVPVEAALGDEWIGPYDKDVFSFTGQAGHVIDIPLAFGGRARLLDSAWNPVPPIGFAPFLFPLPSAGTYYVVVSPVANDTRDPRLLSGRAAGATGPYTLSATDASPDLVGVSIGVTSSPPGPGHVGVSVRNVGGVNPSTVPVAIYLSDDEEITTADIFLGTIHTTVHPEVGDPRLFNGGIDVTFPATDPFRTDNQYWVGTIIDPANQITELSETNNSNTAREIDRTDIDSELHLPSPVDNVNVAFAPGLINNSGAAGGIGAEWVGPYDVDTFTVRPNPNERFAFDLDRTAGTLDAYLRLYDGSWTLLASNDNAAATGETPGTEPFLEYLFPAAGTYFLVVSASGNHTSDPRRLTGRTPAGTGDYVLRTTTQAAGPVFGTVFDDANANGVRDVAEAGVPGWTVYCDTDDDETFTPGTERSAVTDADGSFEFTGVRPGAYLLRHAPQPGWMRTTPAGGVHPLVLVSGQSAGPFLFGNRREAIVSGTVYHDADRDGLHDAGEGGRQNAVLYADANGNRVRDVFAATFDVTGLPLTLQPNATTTFRIDLPGPGPTQIGDVDVTIDMLAGSATVWLSRGSGPSVRLFTRTSTSAGRVQITFDDLAPVPYQNGDLMGAFRPEESLAAFESSALPDRWYLRIDTGPMATGLNARLFGASVAVTLSEPLARSGADGTYVLNGLLPGVHSVRMEVNPDWVQTAPAAGEHVATVAPGDVVADRDFGAYVRQLQIAARHVFYNNSAFDGRDSAANAADDAAIATDKTPLDPGGTRSGANITSYAKGINGVMIDVFELPTAPTLADFAFQVPNSFNPAIWVDAPAPTGFAVRDLPGDNHARRITFTWPDNLLRNVWFQVSVLATPATRRPAPDVTYVGNLVGETPAGGTSAFRIDGADVLATRNAASFSRVTVDNPQDHDRDGYVNIRDQLIVRTALGHTLRPPTFPVPAATSAAARLRRGVPPARSAFLADVLAR